MLGSMLPQCYIDGRVGQRGFGMGGEVIGDLEMKMHHQSICLEWWGC